jgi:ubiquinol-cytochrome c reductase cytochrome c subunit
VRALVAAVAVALSVAAAAGAAPPRNGVVVDAGQHGKGLAGVGASLYAANCSRCHGSGGNGLPDRGPSLRGAGELAADFYLRTGYMPLDDPRAQPERSRPLFPEQEIRAMVAYVGSLGQGPAIPTPNPAHGRVAEGQRLFLDHCAGCHQIAAEGGYVTGARVPPLHEATDRQIAEAVRIGPYLMPRFTERQLTERQLDSLIAYIDYAKHPDDRGGWAIGRLGPWPEGVVTWWIAAAALVATCLVIGTRLRT